MQICVHKIGGGTQPASQASPQALSAGSISEMVDATSKYIAGLKALSSKVSFMSEEEYSASLNALIKEYNADLKKEKPPMPDDLAGVSACHCGPWIQIDIIVIPGHDRTLSNAMKLLYDTEKNYHDDIVFLNELMNGGSPTKEDIKRLKKIEERVRYSFCVQSRGEDNVQNLTNDTHRVSSKRGEVEQLYKAFCAKFGSIESLDAHAVDVPAFSFSAAAEEEVFPPNLQADPDTTVSAVIAFLEMEPYLEEDERILTLLIKRAKRGVPPSKEDLSLLGEIEKRKNRFIAFDPKTNPKVDGSHSEIARLRPKAALIERLYNQLNSVLLSSQDPDGKSDRKADSKRDPKLESKADAKKENAILKIDGDPVSFNPLQSSSFTIPIDMPANCVFPWRSPSLEKRFSTDWTDHGPVDTGRRVGDYLWISHTYSRMVEFPNGKRYRLIYNEEYSSDPFLFGQITADHPGTDWRGAWSGSYHFRGKVLASCNFTYSNLNPVDLDYRNGTPGKLRFDLEDENFDMAAFDENLKKSYEPNKSDCIVM